MFTRFIFATGIENSIPTIQNGRVRIDEMEKCGHDRHWRTDFELVQQLGIRVLRYGAPLHRSWIGPGRYDWSFADEIFREPRRRNIVAIADLCHFGVPDWIGNVQDRDFSEEFAKYALRLYNLDRNIRPVGEAYRELIHDWGAVLPTPAPRSGSAATGAPTTTTEISE